MGLFNFWTSRSEKRIAELERRLHTAEIRSGLPYSAGNTWAPWLDNPDSGVVITREKALTIPAVWRAVSTISDTLASLPFGLFKRTDLGAEPARKHPIFSLVRLEPSPGQTSFNFRRALFAQACFGDAYAKIHRNGVGRASRLEILNTADVSLYQRDDGSIFYIVRRALGNRFVEEVLRPEDVIHVQGITLNGIGGMDVARTHRQNFSLSYSATQYGTAFFQNNAHVSHVLEYPGSLTQQQRDLTKEKVKEGYATASRAGETMVLDAGAKLHRIGLNPGEAMLNDARDFQVKEVARIFGVPAHLLSQMNDATFNNIETMSIEFVTLCLRPWAVQFEQECAVKLLTSEEKTADSHFFRLNLDGLLRGDTQSRASYYNTMFNIGAMSPNDVRELENLNRRDAGDEYFVPLNMVGNEGTNEQSQEMAQPQTDAATAADGEDTPGANNSSDGKPS